MRHARLLTAVSFAAFVVAGSAARAQSSSTLPARLTDKELWQLNANFSEAGGYFRSDNFLSNETGYQYVVPALKQLIKPGGVYLGVGPEQNFTYIVALQPKLAIIFDIRRGNMIEHLMYKALFELSADRADFLSRLFSRPRPSGLDASSTPQQLFQAYGAAEPDSVLYRRNLAAIKERLTKDHGFVLSDSDSKSLDYVYSAFYGGGPLINYNYPNGGGGFNRAGFGRGGMPTYASLQMATDSAGTNWAFLATEANYRWLKDFETKNLLVPVVGDFAGPRAIRAVGQYLKDHNAIVSAFYTSNVEQYLWQQGDDWSKYYKNVATLPIDSTSSFIRSIGAGRGFGAVPPAAAAQQARLGGRLPSVTSSIADLLKAFNDGRLLSYADVITMSR
ncbi:MAG: hypothetical protein JWM41_1158 [Gemmatimonadetes bacterium]|nr:hypothetical protein [Gemmatimonadota bacterium]